MDVQLDQLRALSAVITEGTFDAAASTLQVTPSAISQRIKALETAVGRVLLLRTKPAQVTDSGAAVLRLAREMDLLVASTRRELTGDVGERVPLVLVLNADSLATWIMPALTRVADSVTLDLRREDQGHSTALLRDGTAMAGVTSERGSVPGFSSSLLGHMRYRPRASLEFVERWFPTGVTPASLGRAPVVHFDRKDDLQTGYIRSFAGPECDPPRHYVPGSGAFARAVRLGLGWGMLPDLQVGAGDALVTLDDDTTVDVPLYWLQSRLRTAALEQVARAVAEEAASALR